MDKYTYSANVRFTSMLPLNLDHMMIIQLGGYNCAICHTQLSTREYVQTCSCNPPKESSHDQNWVEATALAESLYGHFVNNS